jgi:hypothetical protein
MDSHKKGESDRPQDELPDVLVPDAQVLKELGGITSMTLWRYDHDASMNFPPPVRLGKRKFRSRKMLEEFKAQLLRRALAERGAEVA